MVGVNLLAKLLLRLIRIINFVSKLWANTCFSTIDAVVAYAPTAAPAITVATFPSHTRTPAQAYGTIYVLAILCLFIEFMPLSLPALRRQACQASAINAGASKPSVCVQQRISMRSALAVTVAMAMAMAMAVALAVVMQLSLPGTPGNCTRVLQSEPGMDCQPLHIHNV